MNFNYNNFPIELQEVAVPKSFSIETGVDSAERLKSYLWQVIHDERLNRQLYMKLIDAGLNKPVSMKNLAIELLPGKFIKVYFVLRDINSTLRGSSKVKKGNIFKESIIEITLYADTYEDLIIWDDSYEATIDHELTHAFQSIDIAIRYLRLRNKNNPNYQPSSNEIMKWVTKINTKVGERNSKKFGGPKDPNKYLAYMASDREMGARAHALLRELWAKDKKLFTEIISYCEQEWPTFDYIDGKLSAKKYHGWAELDAFQKYEQDVFQMQHYYTQSYYLKQELIKKLYAMYLAQYR